jgi:hypothetical protein
MVAGTVDPGESAGAEVIGCGSIVRFNSAPDHIGDIPIKSHRV